MPNETREWTDAEIELCFTYHPPTADMIPDFQKIREKAKELAYLISSLVPDSKERIIAINNIESSVMWSNAGIARRRLTMGVGEPPPLDERPVISSKVNDTPRTDTFLIENVKSVEDQLSFQRLADFCRQLEREWNQRNKVCGDYAATIYRQAKIIPDDVEALLVNIAQILDVVKNDWGREWSEWDQEQRDQITRLLTAKRPPA